MSQSEVFTSKRIAEFLDRHELRWLSTPDHDYVVDFSTDAGPVRVFLAAEGPGNLILVVRAALSRTFGPDSWPLMMALINRWNREYRFAKAFMDFRNEDEAVLFAEHQVLLRGDVDERLLDSILEVGIGTTLEFHAWVAEQSSNLENECKGEGVPSADDLEEWLDRSA